MPEGRWPRGVTLRLWSGQQPRVPDWDGAGTAERTYLATEVRGGSQDELPHVQGQGRWPGGPIPHPGSRGCAGAGWPRGAIPR